MAIQPDGWGDFLAPGETILWQGQPGNHVLWRDGIGLESFVGVIFLLFSVVWISVTGTLLMSFDEDEPFRIILMIFPVLGLIPLGLGLYTVIGRLIVDAHRRGRTWYTLTNQGAFIATQAFGQRQLKRYDIGDMRGFELVDGTPGTVWFGMELLQSRTTGSNRRSTTKGKRIGFREIDHPRQVWDLMAPHRAEAAG